MVNPINRLVDGELKGIMAWYVRSHVARCHRCGPTYKALLKLREGLRKIGQADLATGVLTEKRWQEIEDACKKGTES
jgi:hypothetical protein